MITKNRGTSIRRCRGVVLSDPEAGASEPGRDSGIKDMRDLNQKSTPTAVSERSRRRRQNAIGVNRRSPVEIERGIARSVRAAPSWPWRQVETTGRSWWCGLLAILFGGMATNGHADLLAGWNFNEIDRSASMFGADEGFGDIDPSGSMDALEFFAGTTMNGLSDWPAGESMGFRGGSAEGGSFVVNAWPAPGLGLPAENLIVSFAAKRSATGCDLVRIDQWWNGGWTGVGFSTIGTDWETHQLELPVATPFTDALAFRVTVSGSTGGQGTIRFDNLMLRGTPVPAPGSIALLGVGGMLSRRRRHHRRH